MQPLGFSGQAARPVALSTGGFLTWAAKPSVRESPNPAKKTMDREVMFLVRFLRADNAISMPKLRSP